MTEPEKTKENVAPSVTFVADAEARELDEEIAISCLRDARYRGGIDRAAVLFGDHPFLEEIGSDEAAVRKYIVEFYKESRLALTQQVKRFTSEWSPVQQGFLFAVQELFKGVPFPLGRYVGFVSVINRNPRFLEDKTFQIYWKTKDARGLVAHELLHFIFYAYCEEHFPDLVSALDPNNGLWWDVAELFNNVILSSQQFVELLGSWDPPYPNHVALFPEAQRLYRESEGVDDFIGKLFSYVKRERYS